MVSSITILVAVSEERLRDDIRAYLKRERFAVRTAADGLTTIASVRRHRADVIILDLTLPDMNGLEVCRRLRSFTDAYIIMTSASTDAIDRIVSLEIGADDYIIQPFSLRELLARIRAMMRRLRQPGLQRVVNDRPSQHFGDLRIDHEQRVVTLAGATVPLTAREYAVLALLTSDPGQTWSRAQLLEYAWGLDFSGTPRVVDVCISQIRKKLGDESSRPRYIESHHGRGYRFVRKPD
jgi:two-component system, OmpR family, alkaline phosphatase synthesis response regulator PhoP